MLEQAVRVGNPRGLHARASAKVVRLADQFESSLRLIRDDTGIQADAKSILDVMHLAADHGVSLRIIADGHDEEEAVTSLVQLIGGIEQTNEEG